MVGNMTTLKRRDIRAVSSFLQNRDIVRVISVLWDFRHTQAISARYVVVDREETVPTEEGEQPVVLSDALPTVPEVMFSPSTFMISPDGTWVRKRLIFSGRFLIGDAESEYVDISDVSRISITHTGPAANVIEITKG